LPALWPLIKCNNFDGGKGPFYDGPNGEYSRLAEAHNIKITIMNKEFTINGAVPIKN